MDSRVAILAPFLLIYVRNYLFLVQDYMQSSFSVAFQNHMNSKVIHTILYTSRITHVRRSVHNPMTHASTISWLLLAWVTDDTQVNHLDIHISTYTCTSHYTLNHPGFQVNQPSISPE